MRKPTTSVPRGPVKVRVEFSQDNETGEWVATSLDTPRVSKSSMDVGRARKALLKELETVHAAPVELTEKVTLPPDLAKQVADYHKMKKQLEELKTAFEQQFMPLVKSLQRERLQQQQIAGLLGLSTQWLGQQLKLEATGKHKPTER